MYSQFPIVFCCIRMCVVVLWQGRTALANCQRLIINQISNQLVLSRHADIFCLYFMSENQGKSDLIMHMWDYSNQTKV